MTSIFKESKKMSNKSKTIHIHDIVRLCFSKSPSVKFTEINKVIIKYKEELNKYNDITIPLWVKGRARDLANKTLDFVKKNKDILSYKKNSFNFQEYSTILKFKTSLKNLNLLSNEINKIKSIESKAINEQILKIVGIIGFSILLLWGSYADKDFCGLINICLVTAIIFLVNRIKDVKKNKNGD